VKNERFERYRDAGKWVFVGLIIAAILVGVGFSKGYLVFGSTAKARATEQAQDAVVNATTPICVAQAMKDPQLNERMAVLKKYTAGYDYVDLGEALDKFGWSTMPGSKTATADIAVDCFSRVQEALKTEAKQSKNEVMK
jgi:hypothetical protein